LPSILAGTGGNVARNLAIGGTILSTIGQLQQAKAAQANAGFQAAQYEARANEERASAQRAAIEERRQKELAVSRARAVGAASGGGIDLSLLGDIEEDGELRAAAALYEGEERAKGMTNQAAAARFDGQNAKRAGMIGAAGTILKGGTSFFEKYG